MNKCSVSKNPHFICKYLIISKISYFEVEASWWGFFKDVSSLPDLGLAGKMDDTLDDLTGIVVFFLVHKSDKSMDNVSDDSSEDDEDK